MGGLGFIGNYTYSDSQAKDVDPLRTDNPALLRQTPNTWNMGPSYDRGRLSVHMGFEYNGASIYSYQYENLQANPDGSTSANPRLAVSTALSEITTCMPTFKWMPRPATGLPRALRCMRKG